MEAGREPTGDAAAPASSYDLAPLLAEHAPRLRVEREVIWADGRGLDAAAMAGRLLERLADQGVAARAGVAAVPITAELAARWGPGGEAEPDGPTPFLVKERTGWGRRRGSPAPAPPPEGGASSPRPAPPEGGGSTPHTALLEGRGSGSTPAPPLEAGLSSPRPAPLEGEGSASLHPPLSGGGGGVEWTLGRGGEEGWPHGAVVAVEKGREAEWQGRLPISALRPDARTKALLDGVGIATVGQLAGLEREAVEVRFGGGAVELWRAARADDRRLLFDRIPPERPHGSLDFVDYVLTDPARLVFTANALLGPLCDRLTERGEHARTLRLELPLANGDEWARTLRPARPTASRETWLRLIRGLLDELTVPDAVAGMRIEVPSTEAAAVRQGDLFDRGFATASAVEAAVARLAERQLWPVTPETDAHPALERRAGWKRQDLTEAASAHLKSGHLQSPSPRREDAATGSAAADPATGSRDEPGIPRSRGLERRGLTLQLMAEPRRIIVEAQRRRDHEVPVRIRDRGGWREVAHAAGPDRISGGQWEASSYAREYWRCVTGEGVPLWVYRDALSGEWFLQGWWD